jgi:hypothetical protein
MKAIKVEVSDAQCAYIEKMAAQLPFVKSGDLLLALAFTALSIEHEGCVETITAATREFVVKRHLPLIIPEGIFEYGVSSRAPRQKAGAL